MIHVIDASHRAAALKPGFYHSYIRIVSKEVQKRFVLLLFLKYDTKVLESEFFFPCKISFTCKQLLAVWKLASCFGLAATITSGDSDCQTKNRKLTSKSEHKRL